MADIFEKCWFLSGPTASGKSSVGLELAQLLDAEIISLDSMAIYRGMDIGTAKPDRAARAKIPHHLLDLADPTDDFSLANYLDAAQEAVAEIEGRHKTALFVGGTPLYLKALLRGVCESPPADWEFRRQVHREVAEVGVEALHQRLQQVDPVSAHNLHPRNVRRIIRALEVYRATGQPISHLQMEFEEGRPASACRVFALRWDRAKLHDRINARVDKMFAAGLVDEVKRLLADYGVLGRTASQAVGYREVQDYLSGTASLERTVERVKARTRQFAKRQETWFRSLSECRIVQLADPLDPSAVAHAIAAEGRLV
jgi:tRNA dimethylallyltransferase